MIYKGFKDLKLSMLGMGAMRLPVIDGVYSQIDEAQSEKMLDYAVEHGVNYFDTAWGYHDGQSEPVMGRLLKKYPRENYYLATKFPGYDLENIPKVEEIFEAQLKKCDVEYFDFYLFHNVCEMNIEQYLDAKYGIMEYLLKQKEKGRIRHLGFSVHGSNEVTERFLEKYGSYMEFCQIQLNYVDWTFQKAKEKMEILEKHGIPIWVMEPLRGGKLATLSQKDSKVLKALRPEEEIPAWAFRFLQGIPDIKMVLSGMSDLKQLKENIETFEEEKPLNKEEWTALLKVAENMLDKNVLPCTACRYCESQCPQGLEISWLLSLYNENCFTDNDFIAPMAMSTLSDDKKPGACIGCGSCEAVCPQQIKISQDMSDFHEKMKK